MLVLPLALRNRKVPNERSRGDDDEQIKFRDALNRLRNGDSTEEDWRMFLSRTPGKVNIQNKNLFVRL